MKKQAFFAGGEYYLVPENFASFDEFMKFACTKSAKIRVDKLNEVKCMAPYFVDEAVTSENLSLVAGTAIYPVEVEVLTKQEYHDRLAAIVQKFCNGCANYTDDGNYDELNGHHEEISLDSVCLLRKEEGYEPTYQIYYGIERFCGKFESKKEEIEKLVDSGEISKAKNIVFDLLSNYMPAPLDIAFEKKKKEYYLYFPTFDEDKFRLVFTFVCRYLNQKNIKGWKFVNYLPYGVLKNDKNVVLPRVFELEIPSNGLVENAINFYIGETNAENELEAYKNTYLAICNEIGEDKLLNAIASKIAWFTNETEGKEISFAQFKKSALKKKMENPFLDDFAIPVTRRIASYDEAGVPNKFASYSTELFFASFENPADVFDPKKRNNQWRGLFDDLGISVAKLSISVENSMFNKNIIDALSISLKKIMDSNYAFCIAKELKGNEFNIYFFVAEDDLFVYELKRHSPVFADFAATVEIANSREYKKFNVDYLFKLLEKKTSKK